MKNIFYLKLYVSELCLALFLLGKSPISKGTKGKSISKGTKLSD